MSSLDWVVVIGRNGSIVASDDYLSRGLTVSSDGFLTDCRLLW